jgi:hypothetical protein
LWEVLVSSIVEENPSASRNLVDQPKLFSQSEFDVQEAKKLVILQDSDNEDDVEKMIASGSAAVLSRSGYSSPVMSPTGAGAGSSAMAGVGAGAGVQDDGADVDVSGDADDGSGAGADAAGTSTGSDGDNGDDGDAMGHLDLTSMPPSGGVTIDAGSDRVSASTGASVANRMPANMDEDDDDDEIGGVDEDKL